MFHEHKVLNNAYRVFATFLLEKLNSDGNKIRFCWTQKEQRHWRYNLQKEEENDSVTLQIIHDLIRRPCVSHSLRQNLIDTITNLKVYLQKLEIYADGLEMKHFKEWISQRP